MDDRARRAKGTGIRRAVLGEDEIKEVLLHCAVYAGIPAANSAFRLAEDVLAEKP
jgi:alkylhydroperoxidase/carboxymuconolactone decarboxylase family protein YurZ